MVSRRFSYGLLALSLATCALLGQTFAQSLPSSSSSSKHIRKPAAGSPLDAGSLRDGVYRNQALGITCKVPPGWVLRTEEMNAQEETPSGAIEKEGDPAALERAAEAGCPHTGSCGRVLLAAFSRPPDAVGEEVNASILIAAESLAAYPGLKEAVQYFGPVAEVAKGQGFAVANEPYEFPVGARTLVREDFQKNVRSRVMRQSTLVTLAHGFVISFTFISGAEDDLADLINLLSFVPSRTQETNHP